MVTGVTWQPYYDLHAKTADGKPSSNVSLHYCANITQNTGEDWTNTVLTLSTANSHALHSLTVPRVDPLRLLPASNTISTSNPASTGFSQQLQQQLRQLQLQSIQLQQQQLEFLRQQQLQQTNQQQSHAVNGDSTFIHDQSWYFFG